MVKTKGRAEFVKYFGPVLDALRLLGGSGTPAEVTDKIAEMLKVSETEQNSVNASGGGRFANQVAWARFYLAKEGYLDSSQRGVWHLTEQGKRTKLDYEQAHCLFTKWVAFYAAERKKRKGAEVIEDNEGFEETEPFSGVSYKDVLLTRLLALSPPGFERFCQRLFREAGFKQVSVTGRAGDGGIDGIGLLQVSPLVSFQVLFQCKRYKGSVTPSMVRDFRGAMQGRADKGIILTTGTYTVEARKEAIRDGVPPIELVDRERLVEMCEALELGLKPIRSYEIDQTFFIDFDDKATNKASGIATGLAPGADSPPTRSGQDPMTKSKGNRSHDKVFST